MAGHTVGFGTVLPVDHLTVRFELLADGLCPDPDYGCSDNLDFCVTDSEVHQVREIARYTDDSGCCDDLAASQTRLSRLPRSIRCRHQPGPGLVRVPRRMKAGISRVRITALRPPRFQAGTAPLFS